MTRIEAKPINQPFETPAAHGNVQVGEKDSGKTIDVQVGKTFSVQLTVPGGTGFSWGVTSTNKSFGYPKTSTVAAPMPGGPVTTTFTWATKNPFIHAGETHTVKLGLAFAGKDPMKEITFNVRLTA